MSEEEYIEINEETITDVKMGILKYTAIFTIFVFIPLLITLLTSNSLSRFNIFAGFLGLTVVCFDQIINLGKFMIMVRQCEFYDDIKDEGDN